MCSRTRKNNFILPRYIYGASSHSFSLSFLMHTLSRACILSYSLFLSILNKHTHTHTHSLFLSLYLSIYIYIFFSLVLYPGPGSSTPPFSIKEISSFLRTCRNNRSGTKRGGEENKGKRRGRDHRQSEKGGGASFVRRTSIPLTRA